MDLGTVFKKLDRGEYSTAEAMKADVELVWANALRFNGADSWIAKPVSECRDLAEAKFRHAEATFESAQNAPAGGDERSLNGALTNPSGTAIVTPQMRLLFWFNAKRLRSSEMLEVQRMVKKCCPAALVPLNSGDIKIDVDALDFRSFMRLDVHVRSVLVQR